MHQTSFHLPLTALSTGWSRDHEPVLLVPSGAILDVDAPECSNGQVRPGSTADTIRTLDFTRVDMITGPVYVEGARAGDVLQVDLLDLEPPRLVRQSSGGGSAPGGLPGRMALRLGHHRGACALRGRDLGPDRADGRHRRLHSGRTGRPSTMPPRKNGGNMDVKHIGRGPRSTSRSGRRAPCSAGRPPRGPGRRRGRRVGYGGPEVGHAALRPSGGGARSTSPQLRSRAGPRCRPRPAADGPTSRRRPTGPTSSPPPETAVRS